MRLNCSYLRNVRERGNPGDEPLQIRCQALDGYCGNRGNPWLHHPPSIVLILFGIITEQSIGKLFLAGVIPGLIIAVFS